MESGKSEVWSRLQPHGGTQVPKEIREALGLKPGDVILWFNVTGGFCKVMKGKITEVTREWPHKTNQ
jgi:bifunctional DNA-binding transcriptional regulator/antitoxin component of YhaV-PrlF toxin-antitoxin module